MAISTSISFFSESLSPDLFARVVSSGHCFNSASNLFILAFLLCNNRPPSGDFVHTSFRPLRVLMVSSDDVLDARSWNSSCDISSTSTSMNSSRCWMILLPMPIAACKPENMILEKGIDDIGDGRTPFIRASVKPFLTLQSTCRSI